MCAVGRGLSRAERWREERGEERGDESPARDTVPLEALMVAIDTIRRGITVYEDGESDAKDREFVRLSFGNRFALG